MYATRLNERQQEFSDQENTEGIVEQLLVRSLVRRDFFCAVGINFFPLLPATSQIFGKKIEYLMDLIANDDPQSYCNSAE